MSEREKVIQHFSDCCYYAEAKHSGWVFARTDVLADALALLKAQEPVKPLFSRFYNSDIVIYKCGACEKEIGAEGLPKYCMHCGREVKWDG